MTHFLPDAAWPKLSRAGVVHLMVSALGAFLAVAAAPAPARAADVTFNITKVGELDPVAGHGALHYGDVWGSGVLAFVGSDRLTDGGISIIDISDPANPDFISYYEGKEMEDVEVYGNVGFFASDVNNAANGRTGVDVVNLSDPFNPTLIKRISTTTGYPQAHDKVHTISIDNGFLYTSDNLTPTVKIFNVANPFNPQFVASIDLDAITPGGLPNGMGTHEVYATKGRLFVATKYTSLSNSLEEGYAHIFDVSNVGTVGPKLMKHINTGRKTHTASVSPDGKTMVISQEWGQNSPFPDSGDVRLYDISMIDQENDPDDPVLLSTINKPISDAWSPHHPHIHNDLLFVSWYEAGLQVFNIADRANPILVGAYDTFPGTSTIFSGNWGVFPFIGYDQVLLSDRNRGLIIVDVTAIPQPTPDFDYDTTVTGKDFLIWQRGFGIASGASDVDGDGNRDGKVDHKDFIYWSENIGEGEHFHSRAAGAPVPEGSAAGLAAMAAGWLFSRRRVRRG